MMKSPNILLLMSDQQRADTLGVVNPSIKTPNLDRLASEGTLFERAYAPTPVCLPCRASVLTGQYCSTHGASHNNTSLPEDYPNLLSSLLARRGYYTHLAGKSHLSSVHDPTSFESRPHIHNRDFFRLWHGPWYGFERADINIGHGTEKHAAAMHYGAWLEDQGFSPEKYFGHTGYADFGSWDLPQEAHHSKWVADTVMEGINRAQDRGQPFFIWGNFADPHNPCYVPEPWASMYDPDQIPQFGFKPGEREALKNKPPFYQDYQEQPGAYRCRPKDDLMPDGGNCSNLGWDTKATQANAAKYYGMISLLDHHVGRILDRLDEMGLADDTLVVYCSDHGDMLGDHGMWWKGMLSYEESMRVPMIVRYPGHVPAGGRSQALQSLVDLAPTFCEYARQVPPPSLEGVDQRASWADPACKVREFVVVEEQPFNTNFNERFLITDDGWKIAFYAEREYGELYNLNDDPDQIINLWDAPEHTERKRQMISTILSHEMNKHRPSLGCQQRAVWQSNGVLKGNPMPGDKPEYIRKPD